MGLSIKNAEVERMAREAAARRGVGMTEALRQVLVEAEARDKARWDAERQAKFEELMAIARGIAAMPEVTDLTDDEILGYDENGLPSR
jgi:antitoxin VapB